MLERVTQRRSSDDRRASMERRTAPRRRGPRRVAEAKDLVAERRGGTAAPEHWRGVARTGVSRSAASYPIGG